MMKRKRTWVLSVALIFGILLTGCGKSSATWQDFYNAGIRSAEHQEYEDAISQFEEALRIEPDRSTIYAALADVYAVLKDEDHQADILRRGVDATGNRNLAERLKDSTGETRPTLENCVGMTVDEVTKIWGEGYTRTEARRDDELTGIYYEDQRVPIIFFFTNDQEQEELTGREVISIAEIQGNRMYEEDEKLTVPALKQRFPEGVYYEAGSEDQESQYIAALASEGLYVVYRWETGDDPEKDEADQKSIFREEMLLKETGRESIELGEPEEPPAQQAEGKQETESDSSSKIYEEDQDVEEALPERENERLLPSRDPNLTEEERYEEYRDRMWDGGEYLTEKEFRQYYDWYFGEEPVSGMPWCDQNTGKWTLDGETYIGGLFGQ